MSRGPDIEVSVPEQFNLGTYYLDENIDKGRGGKIAIYYRDETYSYNELCALTNRIGNILKQLNVDMEDRVLLILQDSPEWIASWYAVLKIGGVATHVYTYLQPKDYEYFLNYIRPKVVIVDQNTLANVRIAARGSRFPKTMLVVGETVPALGKNELAMKTMLASASDRLEAAPTSKDDLALWNFSGGTTGQPKGVPHMHHDGMYSYESFQYMYQYTENDVVFTVPKLFFHYARDLGMNFAIRSGGAMVLVPERITARLVFDTIKKYAPTVILNVPTMMRAMIDTPVAERADLRNLRLCLSAGEHLSLALHEEFARTFQIEPLNALGSAESFLGYLMARPGEVVPGSTGRLAPLVEVKIVDNEGCEVPRGETGVLWVRSEASGSCYHRYHEKTKSTFMGEDWINTNDLFREDEKGYFWYSGRSDDLLKVSGVYVSTLEIEKCIEGHPAVSQCVVLGLKDQDGLIKTKAFIALDKSAVASEGMAEEIKQFCKQNMSSYKTPKVIEFLDELPKTGQGKIDKRQLKERGL
ncbi:MAG: benzoate-CoA ligase family protein [Desulfobacterales bacterium]|nr:benzoate-CoA ligase family protein [Desulfobacterales bacterium]